MLTTMFMQRRKYHMQLGEASLPVGMVKVFFLGDVKAGKSTIKRSLTQVSSYFESDDVVVKDIVAFCIYRKKYVIWFLNAVFNSPTTIMTML